jgi:hypothetical protein
MYAPTEDARLQKERETQAAIDRMNAVLDAIDSKAAPTS